MRGVLLTALLSILALMFIVYQAETGLEPPQEKGVVTYKGIYINQDWNTIIDTCLFHSGYLRAAVVLTWKSGTFYPRQRTYAIDGKFPIEVVLEFSGYEALDTQLNTFIAEQSGVYIQMVWMAVRVIDGFKPTCSYLSGVLNYMAGKNMNAGIMTSRTDWISVFNTSSICTGMSNIPFWNTSSGTLGVRNYYRQTQTKPVSICNVTFSPFST